ncbi:MAG TPA: hypothetical protein VKE40_12110 [Gemmataceae bacterium]|nr:hypothetical protein [Gemmataceae bacterium]
MRSHLPALWPAATLCVALLVAPGCSNKRIKTYPVSGQVLYNGDPLKGVDIALHPMDPKNDTGYPPHATTDANGKFTLTTFLKDDGAPAGEFRVAVAFAVEAVDEGSDQGKRLSFQVPEKYHRAETSGLSITIKPGSNDLEPIRLDGPPLPKGKR